VFSSDNDDDSIGDPALATDATTPSTPSTPIDNALGLQRSASQGPPKKKLKLTQGGRVPKGKDFWSQAELFFIGYHETFGKNWAADGWKQCVLHSDIFLSLSE
jgi:hypothetical protein